MKSALLITLSGLFVCLPVAAEFRTLVSSDGKTIKAELVSHTRGKVTIRREDGQEFEIDPAIFCKQDHEAILAWMKENPAKVAYRLRPGASKKNAADTDWSASWFYEITLRNDGQDAVKDIKILHRVLYQEWGNQRMIEGEYLLDQNLEFNRTLALKTETITLNRDRSDRSNGVKGCLIRVLDPKGQVILDWVSSDVGMKDVTWESTNPRDWSAPPNPQAEIR